MLARALSLLGCLYWGAVALQVASPGASGTPTKKPEFPAAELLAWAVNIDDRVLVPLQEKVNSVVDAVQSFTRKAEEVQARVEQVKHLIDPEVFQQVSSITKGISSLASGKHHQANHTKVKRTVVKQTLEERQREPRTRERLRKSVDQMTARMPGGALLGGTVSSALLPEVMSLRRKSGPQQRLLIDKLANISFDSIDVRNFSLVAFVPKVAEVAEALAEAGFRRPATLLNISLPLLQVLRYTEPLLQAGQANLTNAARLVLEVANLPPIATQNDSTLRHTLITLSRLLEEGAARPAATSARLLKEMRIDNSEPVVPIVADSLFFLRDMKAAPPGNATVRNVLSRVADLFNDIGVLPPELAEQLNYPMHLVFAFACSLTNTSAAATPCQAVRV